MRIAEVSNGTVNSVIDTSIQTSYKPDILLSVPGYVEAPSEVDPGWTYKDGQFAPPPEPEPPTLDEAKEAKKAEINMAKWAQIDGGTEYNGIHINTDADAQRLANGAVTQCLIDNTYTCQWKMTDGSYATIGYAEIIGVATVIRMHIQTCFDKEAGLVALIEAIPANAPDAVEQVQAIRWEL